MGFIQQVDMACRDKMLGFGRHSCSKCCSKWFSLPNQQRLDRQPTPPPEYSDEGEAASSDEDAATERRPFLPGGSAFPARAPNVHCVAHSATLQATMNADR